MNEELLLIQTTEISKKYDLLYKQTGGYFNILEVCNVATKETAICRILFELLSPVGSHYQGTIYLKLFFEEVLHLEVSSEELKTAQVFREYVIKENRRIDLVIKTSQKFISIEAKIYADDQKNQCYDYFLEAKRQTDHPKVYYLTRFGNPPDEHSANGLTREPGKEGYKEIVPLSFSVDILAWLNLCLQDVNTIKIVPIREIIFQLIATIRTFTNKMEDNKEMELKKLLMTPENMKSAVSIQTVLQDMKTELIVSLFQAIEKKMKLQKIDNEFDYAYSDYKKTKNFYNQQKSTWPGISYLYKNDLNKEIWVRIEIDHRIFLGYCVSLDGEKVSNMLSTQEIKEVLNVSPRIDNKWVYWEYVPYDDKEKSPNFMNHNEAYYNLFDETYFNQFVDQCTERMMELLPSFYDKESF